MKILAQAPSRVSLFGGGTDIPSYYSLHGGQVISMAINLRTHLKIFVGEDLFGHNGNSFPYNADPKLFHAIFTKYGLGSMHHVGIRSEFDGLIRSGLGSSASASVALIGGLYRHVGKKLDRAKIAEEAWDIEVNSLGWYGGKQDQYAASYGGMNLIEFGDKVKVTPFDREAAERIAFSMVLFHIGGTRDSKDIQKGFKQLTRLQMNTLHQIKRSVITAKNHIEFNYIKGFGQLMNEVWELKKKSNKGVSNSEIDSIYEYAMQCGALGGKILGAGQAGYMLFITEDRNKFIKKMAKRDLYDVDFSIDYNGVETRII